ncbi:MAG: MarR family transcriptional regulator [Labilithrix sp.]|nr:MarR family transcriptional regulator [Labilithrix sp.]
MSVDRRLFLQLHRVNRVVASYVNKRTLEVLGVSAAQLGTLYYLAKHPECSATDLAEVLDLNKSAVSSMLRRLERAELLKRTPNPKDARASRLSLTAKGEAVRAQSLAVTRKLQSEMTQGFSDDEVDTVARFFASVLERFGRDALKHGDT